MDTKLIIKQLRDIANALEGESGPFPIGTLIKIIDAGSGARGCNGQKGMVVDESYLSEHGTLDKGRHFKVLLTNGECWGVSSQGQYKIFDIAGLNDDV